MITANQIRDARALLGWDVAMLGKKAEISIRTVEIVEGGKSQSDRVVKARAKLVAALEAAGVIFVAENGEGPGVRLRKGPQCAPGI